MHSVFTDDHAATAARLTAPEFFVLYHGQDADGREAFKLALAELLALGVLRPAGDGGLAPGPERTRPVGRPLAAVRDLFAAVRGPDAAEVPVADVACAAAARLTWPSAYVIEDVMPALVGHGLYRPEEYRLFLLLPARRFVLTPAGGRLRAELFPAPLTRPLGPAAMRSRGEGGADDRPAAMRSRGEGGAGKCWQLPEPARLRIATAAPEGLLAGVDEALDVLAVTPR